MRETSSPNPEAAPVMTAVRPEKIFMVVLDRSWSGLQSAYLAFRI
jgi:hypothetical protein